MSNLGIDWQTTGANWKYQKQAQFGAYTQNKSTQTQGTTTPVAIQSQTADVLSLSHTSGCTDGVDDGHVGLFSAIENIGKGVGKTIANAARGALGFNQDGSWSPLKLVKTVAIGAVCTVFPPAALVACGIGAVAGGAQIIKGIGNAMSATTDAEAKSAWQNVGAGTFTTAASVVGAKASYKGVMNGAKANGGSALEELAGNGSTKISSLIKEKGITETAKALGKDMWASTKNSWSNIKGFFNNRLEAKDLANSKKKMDDAKKAFDDATADGKTSPEKVQELKQSYDDATAEYNAKNVGKAKEINDAKADKLQAKADNKAAKELGKLQDKVDAAQKRLNAAQGKGKDNSKLLQDLEAAQKEFNKAFEDATQNTQDLYNGRQLARTRNEYAGKDTSFFETKEGAKIYEDWMNLESEVNSSAASYADKFTRTTNFNITDSIKSLKGFNLLDLPSTISSKYKIIMNALQNSEYNSVVNQYGYENVLEALEVFGSLQTLDTVM